MYRGNKVQYNVSVTTDTSLHTFESVNTDKNSEWVVQKLRPTWAQQKRSRKTGNGT